MYNDYTNLYNTQLTPEEEQLYQQWIKTLPQEQQNTADYDLRGYAKENYFRPKEKGHFPDTYKKPNHPTFSMESKYNGTGGVLGGYWSRYTPVFYPTDWNRQNLGEYEDDTAIILR